MKPEPDARSRVLNSLTNRRRRNERNAAVVGILFGYAFNHRGHTRKRERRSALRADAGDVEQASRLAARSRAVD